MNHPVIETLLLGESLPMRRLRALIGRVARTPLSVLIQGPTGAGKELVALALHSTSERPGRFVAFNVCAISESMFEDALFGHVRGAFTGAMADAKGYLAEAHRGTTFLDEVSGLPLAAQVKLLRAIETRQFRPVGGREDVRSDFRTVAATNENLATLVRAGRFRRDLAQRLSGIVLEVPSLSDRLEDVPVLARHFLDAVVPPGTAVALTSGALRVLQSYDWPGNVRELRNVVECAAALVESGAIEASDVAGLLRHDAVIAGGAPGARDASPLRQQLLDALEHCAGDVGRVAARLGKHPATIYRLMRRLGIATPKRLRTSDNTSRTTDEPPPAVFAQYAYGRANSQPDTANANTARVW